jgi:hypothetical protein
MVRSSSITRILAAGNFGVVKTSPRLLEGDARRPASEDGPRPNGLSLSAAAESVFYAYRLVKVQSRVSIEITGNPKMSRSETIAV